MSWEWVSEKWGSQTKMIKMWNVTNFMGQTKMEKYDKIERTKEYYLSTFSWIFVLIIFHGLFSLFIGPFNYLQSWAYLHANESMQLGQAKLSSSMDLFDNF